MVSRARLSRLAAPALVLALAGPVALLLPAAPAEARGRPWPGHPDRLLVDHVVRPGDTATGLATRYHAWTRELVTLNHLDRAGTLRVGETVRIPVVVSALPRHRSPAAPAAPAPAATPPMVDPSTQGWRHWRMTRDEVRAAIGREAHRHGVPVRLAQAVAWQESGWHQPVTSAAGALGVMQVLPATGLWMSLYAGRPLDLRETHDNITAGVTLLRVLLDETRSTRRAVAAYYQGLGAVRRHGILPGSRPYVASVLAIRDRLD
jgi:murein DD-endopeptidase MepM/ murein hydrolase activator NlpD